MRLRGWGGVAAMAAATALTAALLPLAAGDGAGGAASGSAPAHGSQVLDRQSSDDECAGGRPPGEPQRSWRPSGASGPAVQRILDNEQLVVGIDQNSYQWGYRDPESGELRGFDIDLAKAIAADLGLDESDLVFRAIPTSQRVPALQDRKVDMVVRTMTINCDRLKDVEFSTAYFEAGQQVLAPKHSDIKGFDDSLNGKRVCAAEGSTAEDFIKEKLTDATVVPVANQLDCLVRVQLGQADAVITDNALAAGQAAQDPSMELKGVPLTEEYYGVAMNKNDRDLVARVNKVLADYDKSGKWDRAYEDWLKDVMPGITGPPRPEYLD
ncbi:Membrane-bound lytic murein transglycosylase F [Streptomyces sp. RB5]|uniref:Membrane-bound lytic murein transglycosylase F n=1 Tax=Streptomyces smaragdinus TaxID=2585196 RepID=A0A7K0CQQ3_9ACTN|nr:glutamate ABC transporter substrate-binding protein [Streptomyces smaragdinus]MQY15084.1 Membrane-bound lytic murein transglycosylase F [Streptomyces smaragdinus]